MVSLRSHTKSCCWSGNGKDTGRIITLRRLNSSGTEERENELRAVRSYGPTVWLALPCRQAQHCSGPLSRLSGNHQWLTAAVARS